MNRNEENVHFRFKEEKKNVLSTVLKILCAEMLQLIETDARPCFVCGEVEKVF